MSKPFRFTFPIVKAEPQPDGRLLVSGIATSEALDSQGEILSYDGSLAAMGTWLDTGPAVREAHDPTKPVGRGMEMYPDDASRTIGVQAFVSKGAPDTQAKVLDGTLAMFSVGGAPKRSVMEKHGDRKVRRVLEWEMTELSLVDRGANPDCKIESVLWKGDGEMGKKKDDEEEPKETPGETEEKPGKPAAEEGEGKPKPKEGEEEAPPGEPPAKPEPKAKTPQFKSKLCASCQSKIAAEAMAETAKEVMALIASSAKTQAKAEASRQLRKDAKWDVRAALDALSTLEMLRGNEMYETLEGQHAEAPEQIALLDAAIAALKAFTASEAAELVTPPPVPVTSAPVEEVAAAAVATMTKTFTDLVPKDVVTQKGLADVLAPVVEGLRKVAQDQEALGKALKIVHDGVEIMRAQPMPGGPFKTQTPAVVKAATAETNNAEIEALMLAYNSTGDAGNQASIRHKLNLARARVGLQPV